MRATGWRAHPIRDSQAIGGARSLCWDDRQASDSARSRSREARPRLPTPLHSPLVVVHSRERRPQRPARAYVGSHSMSTRSAAARQRLYSVSWGKQKPDEGRRQKAEGRRQKAEGRRQKAEGRRQKAEENATPLGLEQGPSR